VFSSVYLSGGRPAKPDSETSDSLMTVSFDDMIMNGEKNSFKRMIFDRCRLERIEEVFGR